MPLGVVREREEWINKFVDFGQSGKTGENGDCMREGRKAGREIVRAEEDLGGGHREAVQ